MIIVGIIPSGPVTVTSPSRAGGLKISTSSSTGAETVLPAVGLELDNIELAGASTGCAVDCGRAQVHNIAPASTKAICDLLPRGLPTTVANGRIRPAVPALVTAKCVNEKARTERSLRPGGFVGLVGAP